MRRATLLPLLAAAVGLIDAAVAADLASSNKTASSVELALQYDFLPNHVSKVRDFSGKDHNGTLRDGEIVSGRQKHAVKFSGQGVISTDGVPDTLDPQARPLTVGAYCRPASPEGVLVSMGDHSNGFSLYLHGGVPHFAVRADGKLFTAAAADPVVMDQWVHLAGAIDGQGRIWVVVNGWPGTNVEGKVIPRKPAEPFSVGADPGSPVGQYASTLPWHGLIQDIRLYWGFMDRNENRDQWGDWANLPGCGCRK